MIDESGPWRSELLRIADRLERRKTQMRWPPRARFLVERDVMVGAYVIRKLREARKLSDSLIQRRLSVLRFDRHGDVPDLLSLGKTDQQYDLENPQEETMTLKVLHNQIIHSWVWHMRHEEKGGMSGIIVSSDHQRRFSAYFVSVEALIGAFRDAGNEDITSMYMTRNKQGEMDCVHILTDEQRGNHD